MKNKKLFILIMIAFSCNLYGQTTFQKKLKGNGSIFGVDIVTDNNNGYNIIGNININDSSYIFNSKLNLEANVIWSKLLISNDKIFSNKLIQLDNGRLIIGYTKTNTDTIKGLVIKTDNNGNIIWSRTYKSGKTLRFNDVLTLPDKSCFLVGLNDSLGNDNCILVTKIDSLGQVLFSKTYKGNGNESGNSIIHLSDSNYAIVGYSTTNDPLGDILVMKIDSAGNKIWSKSYDIIINSYKNQIGYGIIENHRGEIVVCGSSKNYEFSPGNEPWGPVVLWINQNGTLNTMKHYGINSGKCAAYEIKELNNYEYIFSGKMGANFALAAKLDSTGTALWTMHYPNIGGNTGASKSMSVLNQNEFIIIGDYYLPGDTSAYLIKTKNSGISGCNEGTPAGQGASSYYPTTVSNISLITDNFAGLCELIQINNTNLNLTDSAFCSDIINGIYGNIISNKDLHLYPIPAKDNITIENSALSEHLLISIYSIEGELLIEQTTQQVKTDVDISGLASGIYIIKATSDKGVTVKKFIKE
ncbi:MAG: T9SS type A sorting domain-containing protein [Lentimicrobium sp.]